MTDDIQAWLYAIRGQLPTFEKALEIGSLAVNPRLLGARPVFNYVKEYVGIDLVEGLGVDKVIDMHELSKHLPENYFDLVVCTEVLEHDPKFWVTIEEINKVLKKGGHLIVTVPFTGEYHPYPKDYWRFMEDGMKDVVFNNFAEVEVARVGTAMGGYGKKK